MQGGIKVFKKVAEIDFSGFFGQFYASPHCAVRGTLIWITGLVFFYM